MFTNKRFNEAMNEMKLIYLDAARFTEGFAAVPRLKNIYQKLNILYERLNMKEIMAELKSKQKHINKFSSVSIINIFCPQNRITVSQPSTYFLQCQ